MMTSLADDPTRASDDELDNLVHRADLDSLIRLVDNRTAAHDWAGLRRARDRCRHAVTTGRQLWPAATLAEYRLALVAPAEWAAAMINEEAGLFTIGPLTEVVAQHHSWSDLAPALPDGPRAAVVAHERVLRGESVDPVSVADLPGILEMPFELASWEPTYPLATYSDSGVDAPPPIVPAINDDPRSDNINAIERFYDNAVDLAVRQLVEPWTASSNGHAEVVSVVAAADDAVRALGIHQPSLVPIPLAEALAWLGWAGASGGAHGRRRGAALGRFGALWTLAALLDVVDDWPLPLDELGDHARELQWFWWEAGEPVSGWRLQLAVEDRIDGVAWAIAARDDASDCT